MLYLGRRERATSMPLWGVGIITLCLPILGRGIQVASTYSWSSGTAAGEGAEAVKIFAEVEHAGDMGVLRRRAGRGSGTENRDRKQNLISFAYCKTTYLCQWLLDRAVAVLGLVESCTCMLDWKPFYISEPTAKLSFHSACDLSSSCSLRYSCAKCEEHKFPSYLYVERIDVTSIPFQNCLFQVTICGTQCLWIFCLSTGSTGSCLLP